MKATKLGIVWDRLVSIADEMVTSLVRSSFSTLVRESGDLSCVIFDEKRRALAQGSFSQPSFTGTAPLTLSHMLGRFPPERLEPGDVLITNDPWMGTGHLFDISVMMPILRSGEIVGYAISVTHLPDIGGLGFGTVARDIYEEGHRIPIQKLVKAGRLNEDLLEIILANVRAKEMVRGDILAHVACLKRAEIRVLELLDDYTMAHLSEAGDGIIERTSLMIDQRLDQIADFKVASSMQVEGTDGDLTLAVAIEKQGRSVSVDFSGTDGPVPRGINVPLCYTRAFTLFSFKCLLLPDVPNNQAFGDFIAVSAPTDCLLNAQPPWPTGGRHIIGHFVTPLIFGALQEQFPEGVQADCGMLTQINCQGIAQSGRRVATVVFASGGYGALHEHDGQAAVPGPGNMIGCSAEIIEQENEIVILSKELLPDSGGAGRHQGGNGQRVLLMNDSGSELSISFLAARDRFPPRGFLHGQDGQARRYLLDGKVISPKGRYSWPPGSVIETHEAGGGGLGDPSDRQPRQVAADLAIGCITEAFARRHYPRQFAQLEKDG